MKGKFIANRVITEYNTITKKIKHIETKITYEIFKVGKYEYLMKQYEPSTNTVIEILFVKNAGGYISSSDPKGVDNLYFNKDNNLIHSWTDKKNSDYVLTNAYAVLEKI